VETGGGAGWKTSACGLDHATHMVDEQGTGAYKNVPGTDHGEVSLSFLTTMKDRREKLGIETSQASKIFGIDPVFFAGIVVDQTQLTSISHDDLMAKVLQGLTCPARVSSHLHGDTRGRDALELCGESCLRGGNTAFFDQFPILIENNDIRKFISKVNSNENCAIVRHGPVPPFAPMSALIFGNILHKMEPVFEGPAFSY